MKKQNLNRWLSVLLSAMVIAGTITVPAFAKAADIFYDPAIAQDYSEESLLGISDQQGNEPDEMAYSETAGDSAQGLEDDTVAVTEETADASAASTAVDAAEAGTTENEAAPVPGELSDPDWEETDPYTSDSETAVEEGTDLDDQLTEEQESNNSDNQLTEEQESNGFDDQLTEEQESNGFDDQLTEEQESSNSDNQLTEEQESNNSDNQLSEEQESNNSDNQITEEQTETDYNNQGWNEEADYIDQPVENEENTNSSSELPEETDVSSVSDSVLLDNNSSNEINPDEADSEEEISDVLILEESDSEEAGSGETDTEYYADETEFHYADNFGNQGETDALNSITEEVQEETVSDEAYNNSETSGICGEGLTWMIDSEGTVTITGTGEIQKTSWPSDMKKVIIENGVTGIGEFAFQDPNDMEEVVIPSTITSIGRFAFMCCDDLKRVDIPSGVTVIREGAFGGCSGLTSVSIPSGVTSIEDQAFRGCWRLKEVILPPNLTTIGEEAFSYCSALTSLRIPGSVTSMSGAFGGCEGLTTVEISEGVTSVGGFSGCSSLTSITIPEGVTSIEDSAFYGCGSLTDISIPGSLTSIGKSAFFRCFNLQNVQYGGTKEEWTRVTVQDGNNALLNALGIVEKPSPDEIVESGVCGDNLTWELNGEGTLTISGTGEMTSSPWQDNRSGYDEDIKSVIIQDGVTSICGGAFLRLDELVNVTIPSSVKTIEEFAFSNSGNGTGLVSIVIPEGVTSIGQQAFDGCQKLTNVTIPSSMTEIGNYAFMGCTSLTNVDIQPNEHGMSIGEGAFWCCGSLTNIIIPSGVTSIGSHAFEDCSSLRTVTLPKSIKNIGCCIFMEWNSARSNLQTVKYAGTEADWASVVVDDNNNGLTHALCFTNADAVDVSGAWTVTFDKPAGYTYTGKAIEPQVTVTEGTKVLELGVDYSVSYKNNKEIGLGAVVIVPSTPGYDEWIEETFVIKDTCTVTFDANGGGFIYSQYGDEIEFRIGTGEFERGELLNKAADDEVRLDNYRYYFAVNDDIHKVCVGWSLTRNGSPLDDEYKVYSDITVYAVWEEVYSVVLCENGGDIEAYDLTSWVTSWDGDFDVSYPDFHYCRYHRVSGGIRLPVHKGSYLQLPAFCESGYGIKNDDTSLVFGGWGLSANGKNVSLVSTFEGMVDSESSFYLDGHPIGYHVSTLYKPTGDCTLYALWKDSYTVKLNTNGGGNYKIDLALAKEDYTRTVDTLTMKCAFGSPMSSADVDYSVFTNYEIFQSRYDLIPKDKNRKLLGWSTSKNGKPFDLETYVPQKDCTLYAIWAYPISRTKVSGISSKNYTGKAISQALTVKDGSTTLKAGTDYKLTYKNNVNVGTATVVITGMGNYTGTVSKTFKINKAAQTITAKPSASLIAVGKAATVSIGGSKGAKSYKSSNTAIATVDKNGKITAKKAGTVKITVTSAATGSYKAASKTITIKVVPAATVSLKAVNQTTGIKLTWKKVAGANGYLVYRNGKKIATIGKATTVTYTDKKANTNGAKYTYRIVAKASTGNSTLSKSLTTYRVIRPAVKSVKNTSSKKAVVTWGKNTKATGYEIQYGLKKNFSGAKKVTVKKKATVKTTLSKLTKGKIYYIRIRTYKTVGKTKYYSTWSTAKKVKISK